MKNRRLLIILIVFICLGAFAILGSTLFAVRTVNVNFINEFSFFRDEHGEMLPIATVEAELRDSALPVTLRRNSVFGINDDRVKDAIEGDETRVWVTNIERKFPNRIDITVRERYPVFMLQFGEGAGTMTAVLCGRLRVLDVLTVAQYNALPSDMWPLVDMPDQIKDELELKDMVVGKFLSGLDTDEPYIGILEQIVPHFARLQNFEDAICNIFESMSFGYSYGGGIELTLKSRPPNTPGAFYDNYFEFVIRNAESPRLTQMLTKAWMRLNLEPDRVTKITAWEAETFTTDEGIVFVEDGIILWVRRN